MASAPVRPIGESRRDPSIRGRIAAIHVAPSAAPLIAAAEQTPEKVVETRASASTRSNDKLKGFSRAAHSIVALHKLQSHANDVKTMVKRTALHPSNAFKSRLEDESASPSRPSLVQVVNSPALKALVQKSRLVPHVSRKPAGFDAVSSGMPQSVAWTTQNAHDAKETHVGADKDDELDAWLYDDPPDVAATTQSTTMTSLYCRTLLLEESCRRALRRASDERSPADLDALATWFRATNLQIVADFHRLDLELLCRRMTCVTFRATDTICRQGDDGDALFLVFTGTVEIRVAQRLAGDVVEVTVGTLSKGEFFGERALLTNEVRAATVVATTATELVRITRSDYDQLLRHDQLAFLSRMRLAHGMGVPRPTPRTSREYLQVLTKPRAARTPGDMDVLSDYLHTLKFFRTLPPLFIRELCTVIDTLSLPAGACVFCEGEVGDRFYIILSGSVDVTINAKDVRGKAQVTKLVTLTEGAHFGELALLNGRGVRSATVRTREACQFLVLCEHEYKTTLRRQQKRDLRRRVAVLTQMPLFQMPAWTTELVTELSYVLLETKLTTGTVLYHQGDRASHVYFIVRGEVRVTKILTDPISDLKHEVELERVGRLRVVGDDAAAGWTFHDVVHREVTVTASTPVELLLLSKYDVFHRLSPSARETLRAAAHAHAETIVYLDRFVKTQQWTRYKQKVLQTHLNQARLAKLLPLTRQSRPRPVLSALLPANELILLTPDVKQPVPSHQTLGHYVTSFNADAPPSSARQRQLQRVLGAERARLDHVLREGNPIASFDLTVVESPTGTGLHSIETDSATKLAPGHVEPVVPSPLRQSSIAVRPTGASLTLTSQELTHLLQDNFIFSRPRNVQGPRHATCRVQVPQAKVQNVPKDALVQNVPKHALAASELNEPLDNVLYVLLAIRNGHKDTRNPLSLQLLSSARVRKAIDDDVKRSRNRYRALDCKLYLLPLNAFAVMAQGDGANMQQVAQSFTTESDVPLATLEEVFVAKGDGDDTLGLLPGRAVDFEAPIPSTIVPLVPARPAFAVASFVLIQHEVADSQFVAVHATFASKIEAATFAMRFNPLPPCKKAMVCVVPLGTWVDLDHAHEWCVPRTPHKREQPRVRVSEAPALSPSFGTTNFQTVPPPHQLPLWQQERDEAQRLHDFICTQMGTSLQDKKKDRSEQSGRPRGSLEAKLDTLHTYLETTAAASPKSNPGSAALLKFRHVKRFHTIMRSRLASAVPHDDPTVPVPLADIVPKY